MSRRKSVSHHTPLISYELTNIIAGGILVTLAVLMVLSTQTSVDPLVVQPFVGRYLSQGGYFLFGTSFRWVFAPILMSLGMMILVKRASWSISRFVGILLFWLASTSIIGWYTDYRSGNLNTSTYSTVGIFDIFGFLKIFLGSAPAFLALIILWFVALYLTLRISYRAILSRVRESVPSIRNMRDMVIPSESDEDESDMRPLTRSKIEDSYKKKTEELERKLAAIHTKKSPEITPTNSSESTRGEGKIQTGKSLLANAFSGLTKKIPLETPEGKKIEQNTPHKPVDFGTWDFPSIGLLNDIQHIQTISPAEIEEKSLRIQKTFLQFNIDVEMVDESVGPTVTQYRLHPSDGVHLTKIKNLKDNLTLSLKAKSIRIQAPIPGLGLVGIEVPNEKRDTVGIKEVLEDRAFTHHKSKLAIAIGKDINGDFIVGDLAKMPHLLIAGQTGSGKSVGMNGFILSLLYKNTPSELRMIMVDPKQVELGIYDGIPHLLTPVINSPDKALNALKWGVAEMERRYSTLKPLNARNLEEYNAKVSNTERMPTIVIIIDELADLMMSGNKKEVEAAITRIAQKARAVGLHMILATQRPSVDVITGLIKANVPSRVAFTVASGIDSRTILDAYGAEDLLGRGDMLYFPTGAMAHTRIQGVLVDTDEVERVVGHIRRTIDPAMLADIYDASIVDGDRSTNWEGSSTNNPSDAGLEDQAVIEEAIELVRSAGKCSTSMLQRHLKLGYGRAARVVDILESMGIVGPADGSKPREVIG